MRSKPAFPRGIQARASVHVAPEVAMAAPVQYRTAKLCPGIGYRRPVARQFQTDAAMPGTRAGSPPHDDAAA